MYIKHISQCRYYIKSVNNKFWKQQITSKLMSSFSGFVSNAPPCHSNVNDGIFQCCFSDACRYVNVMEIERAQKGMDKKPKSQTCMWKHEWRWARNNEKMCSPHIKLFNSLMILTNKPFIFLQTSYFLGSDFVVSTKNQKFLWMRLSFFIGTFFKSTQCICKYDIWWWGSTKLLTKVRVYRSLTLETIIFKS